MITGMNELEISGDDYTLTRLDISYVPRVV